MHTGEFKAVKDLQVGDLLRSADGTSCKIITMVSETSDMYRITPTKGDPYIISDKHIISIRCSRNAQIIKYKNEGYRGWWMEAGVEHYKEFKSDLPDESYSKAQEYASQILAKNITHSIQLIEYLTKSKRWKSNYKGYRTGFQGVAI